MGFWDTVKKVATSAKCMTGFHAGQFKHIAGEPECYVAKTCPDCNEYITDRKHKYNDFSYDNFGSCDSTRTCDYCGYKDHSVVHQLENKGKDENCRIIKKCQRCRYQELGRESHSWVQLLGYEFKVEGKRKCKDCGKMES